MNINTNINELLLYLLITTIAIDAFVTFNFNVISPSHFLVLFLVIITHYQKGLKLAYTSEYKYLLIISFIIVLASLLFSNDLYVSLLRSINIIYYIIIGFYLINNLPIKINRLFFVYATTLNLVCLFALLNGISFSETLFYRFSYHQDYNPTWLAAHLLGALFLAYPAIRKTKGFKRSLVLVLTVTSLYFLFLTQGRTALLAIFLSFIITYLFKYIKRLIVNFKLSKRFIFLVGIIVLFISLSSYYFAIIFNEEQYFTRTFVRFATGDYDSATAGRSYVWITYWDLYRSMTFPVGLGMSSIVSGINPPHNNYLLLLFEGSIILLLVWILFHFKLILKSKNTYEVSIGIFFLIFSMGNDMLNYKYYWLLVYIYLLIIYSDYGSKRIR